MPGEPRRVQPSKDTDRKQALVSSSPTAESACPSGPEIPLPVIDFDDELAVSSPDDPEDIIDHLFDATDGIDALREINRDDEEQDR
jgi:hypothetical protein